MIGDDVTDITVEEMMKKTAHELMNAVKARQGLHEIMQKMDPATLSIDALRATTEEAKGFNDSTNNLLHTMMMGASTLRTSKKLDDQNEVLHRIAVALDHITIQLSKANINHG